MRFKILIFVRAKITRNQLQTCQREEDSVRVQISERIVPKSERKQDQCVQRRGIRAFRLTLCFWASFTEQFTVSSSWSHQVATVGGQAELSCQISPPQNANHMDVGWFRDHYTQMIRTHKDGRKITEKNIQNSKDRTVLLKDDLGTGKMILQIHNITVSDGGKYYCFFEDGHTYEEASTDLQVAGKDR